MFWLILVLFLGGSYLFYRYQSLSDKKLFFKSPIFVTSASSLGILLVVYLLVNLYSTATPPLDNREVANDTIQIDTTFRSLADREPVYHYQLIINANKDTGTDNLDILKEHYEKLGSQTIQRYASIGHFGLGFINLKRDHADEALTEFEKVSDNDFPYLHYCKGEAYLYQDKELLAIELRSYNPPDYLFTTELARIVSLHNLDLGQYLYQSLMSIVDAATLSGFVAAMAILITWLIYLSNIDLFNTRKALNLILMTLSGIGCILIITIFNDLHDLFIDFALNGAFFHDLAYAIIMIGIPEEFTKIFSLLILVLIGSSIKEPIHFIVYASASALGFAFIENLLYFQDVNHGIIHGRAYFSVITHMADSSFVAYGFILSKFKYKTKSSYFIYVPLCFLAGSVAHGLYDFLLFHNHIFIFYLYFIFIIQVWIIIINNSLNNSPRFLYRDAFKAERARLYITLALTSILALEYVMVGFTMGAAHANHQLLINIPFAGVLIVFFSSDLSSFNLIKGYWRDVYFSSREKRGYGTLPAANILTSWYLVNSIRPHNYVGQRIILTNDQFNHTLAEVMEGPYEGTIINRFSLYEGNEIDPHWFIVKLDERFIPLVSESQKYVIVKLRYQNESLIYEDDVQIFFKAIPDLELLKQAKPQKSLFPFYGWVTMALNREVNGANISVKE